MAVLLGREAKAYYNNSVAVDLDGSNVAAWLADPGTLEVKNIIDVSLDISTERVDATTRDEAEHGWAAEVPVLHTASITFDMTWDKPPQGQTNVMTNLLVKWNAMDTIAMAFLDVEKATLEEGLVGNFGISITKSENARDIQRVSVTLTPSDNVTWYKAP